MGYWINCWNIVNSYINKAYIIFMPGKNNNGITITKGWKGYAGALGCIALGVYLVLMGEKVAGAQLIFLGLALLGIRHKLDYNSK